ncbi:CRISPR-associated endonuclease Cas3'' [Bacillus sp. NPDC057893]|uniref:CRISPR-associated endonuclease Cas3'' n=1 Tax=Bacillus sp. NPDC057893 TaxID=3346273 RepID=UPI00366CC7B9
MNYIAHIRESDKQVQTVEEHLLGVKELAETYGKKINIKHLAGLAGMLHDLGKYTNEFREYILEAVNNPDSPSKRGSVDHSTAGGKFLYQFFHTENITPYKGIIAEIVGNAIISHHGYLAISRLITILKVAPLVGAWIEIVPRG